MGLDNFAIIPLWPAVGFCPVLDRSDPSGDMPYEAARNGPVNGEVEHRFVPSLD